MVYKYSLLMSSSVKIQIEDVLAVIVSVLLFQFFFEFLRIDGSMNGMRILIDSIAGCLCYFLSFFVVDRRFKLSSASQAAVVALIGSSLWIMYKLTKGLVLDWSFISDNFDKIYVRHISIGLKAFVIVVPLLALLTFSVIIVCRLARRVFASRIR